MLPNATLLPAPGRAFLATALVATLAPPAATPIAAQTGASTVSQAAIDHKHDWDWLVGRWKVRHHRLKVRLVGSREWEDFDGSCVMWPTMDGLGNVDDNVLEIPSGTYRAMGIRAYDPKTGQWSIWWLDGRAPEQLDVPVRGGFTDGVGTFTGEATFNGKPILMRFRWTEITATSAHWEQAFSPDGGKSWETNWTMEFVRAGN